MNGLREKAGMIRNQRRGNGDPDPSQTGKKNRLILP